MNAQSSASSGFPIAPLFALDTLWFQVAGTLCNLQCMHCFISCSTTNHAHEMLTLADVKRHLREAEALGVKEYYFTGGEPFMNHEIFEILEETLCQGPVSVLTNGVLIRADTAARLKIMPLLRIGAEEQRLRAYESWETLKGRELTPDEAGVLQCTGCRMVTSKGVYVCPILIDSPDAKMGETLKDTMRPFQLSHQACFTCHETGFSCRT